MIKITLASNYQTLEMDYPSIKEMGIEELDEAINLINEIGSKVNINTTKMVENNKKFEEPTPKQFDLAKKLKIDITGMDKEEARKAISKVCNKA